MKKKILVIGSMNTDMVVKTPRIPHAGETILGGIFSRFEGGKGANQAIAAKMLFPDTSFCAGVGDDSMGADYLRYLKARRKRDNRGARRKPAAVAQGHGENKLFAVLARRVPA